MYDGLSLKELKVLGHKMINEYISLKWGDKKNSISHAYEKMQKHLGTMYGKHHFGKMETRHEAIRACSALRLMIKRRKQDVLYRKEKRAAEVFWRKPKDEGKAT